MFKKIHRDGTCFRLRFYLQFIARARVLERLRFIFEHASDIKRDGLQIWNLWNLEKAELLSKILSLLSL